MKIEKYQGDKERRIVTALIVNRPVLAKIQPRWDGNLFSSRHANLIAGWCFDYFTKYDSAPGKAIEGIFRNWTEKAKDDESIQQIEKILHELSGEYERISEELNPEFTADLAGKYFNRVKLSRLAEGIQADLDTGNLEQAQAKITEYSKVELGSGVGVDVVVDQAAVFSTFDEQDDDTLIQYPGALGLFFQGVLERDRFVSFSAPDKTGKSYWLLDMAWRAMLQRRRVAFFEVGDMSEKQVKSRFMVRAAGHPIRSKEWPCQISYPLSISKSEGDDIAQVETGIKRFKSPLDKFKAWKACQEIQTNKVKSKNSYLRISVHPTDSISIYGIKSILQDWERQGWIADVVIIDYADILAAPPGKLEEREAINKTWKQMRALSQERHCLVVTATQTDADAYDRKIITRKNFSGDKRKNAHVDGMIGLNVSTEEKEIGVTRLNWIVKREGEYSSNRCVHVAGCLALANPAVRSTF